MACCWVSEASDAARGFLGLGLVGFLLFDSWIVDASIHTHWKLLVGVFVV